MHPLRVPALALPVLLPGDHPPHRPPSPPPPCVVSAEADAGGEVFAAIQVLHMVCAFHADWPALACLALGELIAVVRAIVHDVGAAKLRVSIYLKHLINSASANRHMKNWQRCWRLYEAPDDRHFWKQMLFWAAANTGRTKFTMSILLFLSAEYNTIAAHWATREARHALWTEVCMCGYQLPDIIWSIGNTLAKKGWDDGHVDGNTTGFHQTAQSAYARELKWQPPGRIDVATIVDQTASAAPSHVDHATVSSVYEADMRAPSLEAEHKHAVAAAAAAAEETDGPSEREFEYECTREPQRQSHSERLMQPSPVRDEAMRADMDNAKTHTSDISSSPSNRTLEHRTDEDDEHRRSDKSSLHGP